MYEYFVNTHEFRIVILNRCAFSGNSTDVMLRFLPYIGLKRPSSVSFMQPDPDTPRLLDVIEIPEPCQVPWETMSGDERIRFCGMCKKNVYNISELSNSEAESFLGENLGSVCLSFIRRADGTIVTDNCPKILKPVRAGFRRLKKIVAIVLGAVISTSASLAQTENKPQISERDAALAAGTYGKRTRMAGYIPNVWHNQEQRLPPGFITPVKIDAVRHDFKPQQSTSLSLQELTTGDFALEFESELYMKDGKAFIDEERKTHNTQKEPVYYTKRAGACIDGYTATVAFLHAKEWVAKHDDRIAESYFKLSLKSIDYLNPEPKSVITEIVREYADLLKRTGRVKQSKQLLERDVATICQKRSGSTPQSLLGIAPAMLSRRPKPTERMPTVRPPSFAVPVPMLNPFAPTVHPQSRDAVAKKTSPKFKKARR